MLATRRAIVAGSVVSMGAVLTAPFAFAQTRMSLPGGGSVILPSPYDKTPGYSTYGARVVDDILVGYRNWRATMSGQPECDGLIAVARADRFDSLERFIAKARGARSIQWSDADRIPGQPWDGNEKRYPTEERAGANGTERTQQLAVHRVGFFGVYDEAAHMFGVADQRGVHVGVWLYDKQGGLAGARKIANKIASSFQA